MRFYLLLLSGFLLVFALILLVISLTDIVPSEPLKGYRTVIGMGFIAMGGFTRLAYTKWRQ